MLPDMEAQSQPGAGRRTQDGRRPASDEGAVVRPVLDGRRRRDWRHQQEGDEPLLYAAAREI